MIRDHIKNDRYFSDFLKHEEHLLDSCSSIIRKRKELTGDNDKGVLNGTKMLSIELKIYIIALYSSGASLSKIRDAYSNALYYNEKVWDDDESYVDLLWIVSIGILLNVDDAQLLKIKSMIENQKMHDKLVDFLIYSKDKEWPLSANYFMEKPYTFWDWIICKAGNNRSIALIKSYLQNDWYSAHRDLYWYDLHKSKNNTYFGYWSFETGAIVKILGINDTELKDIPYYPYDLVHYHC